VQVEFEFELEVQVKLEAEQEGVSHGSNGGARVHHIVKTQHAILLHPELGHRARECEGGGVRARMVT
jgi:hypothetical protein